MTRKAFTMKRKLTEKEITKILKTIKSKLKNKAFYPGKCIADIVIVDLSFKHPFTSISFDLEITKMGDK